MNFHCGAGDPLRPVIYQLMVRTFGNTNETGKSHGSLAENGCGKFSDINEAALKSLKEMGFTHIWLTGVLEHASLTAYAHRPADSMDVVKGVAGSPYAIKDYFDVSPDYAECEETRLDEFRALVDRIHAHGLKVMMDFVPNHVARDYQSDVRPDLAFGVGDDPAQFFSRDHSFYYLQPGDPGGGPPLRLPHSGPEGYLPERTLGKVTGNNVISWRPSEWDWYETVKLNYGHDFRLGRDTSDLPGEDEELENVPKTWRIMDEILGYWQNVGVDGFRVDMAHMIPMEFWRWEIKRSRQREARVYWMAEAYDGDPAKLVEGNVFDRLIEAGFDAVYDDWAYETVKGFYQDGKWMNDLNPLPFTGKRFHRSLRYVENHDEVRLAHPGQWGGHGFKIGKPASAILFGMGRGPIMMYQGQEVGERAEGLGENNGRSSIFDYGFLPSLVKWVNGGRYDGGRLSEDEKSLRRWYQNLLKVLRERAFVAGEFYGLNEANRDHAGFGRLVDERASGHWLCAFLRRDTHTGQAFLVVVNAHATEAMKDVEILIPTDPQMFVGHSMDREWIFEDRLSGSWRAVVSQDALMTNGLKISELKPCEVLMLEISINPSAR